MFPRKLFRRIMAGGCFPPQHRIRAAETLGVAQTAAFFLFFFLFISKITGVKSQGGGGAASNDDRGRAVAAAVTQTDVPDSLIAGNENGFSDKLNVSWGGWPGAMGNNEADLENVVEDVEMEADNEEEEEDWGSDAPVWAVAVSFSLALGVPCIVCIVVFCYVVFNYDALEIDVDNKDDKDPDPEQPERKNSNFQSTSAHPEIEPAKVPRSHPPVRHSKHKSHHKVSMDRQGSRELLLHTIHVESLCTDDI